MAQRGTGRRSDRPNEHGVPACDHRPEQDPVGATRSRNPDQGGGAGGVARRVPEHGARGRPAAARGGPARTPAAQGYRRCDRRCQRHRGDLRGEATAGAPCGSDGQEGGPRRRACGRSRPRWRRWNRGPRRAISTPSGTPTRVSIAPSCSCSATNAWSPSRARSSGSSASDSPTSTARTPSTSRTGWTNIGASRARSARAIEPEAARLLSTHLDVGERRLLEVVWPRSEPTDST